MENGGVGLILGGQKSSKMMTFSKHEKHEKSMAGAANLRLQGGEKVDKNQVEKKTKKTNKSNARKNTKLEGSKGS